MATDNRQGMGTPHHAIYAGREPRLMGKSALVRPTAKPDEVAVQFDDLGLGSLALGWHVRPAAEFKALGVHEL